MSKSLLLKLVVFLFILLSAVVCESGKIKELFEIELWHWTLCIYGSSLVCCSLQRFSLVLLCFVCIGKIQTVMGVIFLVSMLFKLIVIQCPPYPAWSPWSFVNALKGTTWETVMGYAH